MPSAWAAWLRPGQGFEAAIDETGRGYPAKVTRLGGRVDPVSRSMRVYAGIEAPAGDLLVGMSGRADLAPPPPR